MEAAPVYRRGLDDETVKITKAIYLTPCCRVDCIWVLSIQVLDAFSDGFGHAAFCIIIIISVIDIIIMISCPWDSTSFLFSPFFFCSECLSKCLCNEIPHYPPESTSFRALCLYVVSMLRFHCTFIFLRRCMNFFLNKVPHWNQFASYTMTVITQSIEFCFVDILT